MRVVVAMSGGVDSAVAAAILKEQGHQVIGITMRLLEQPAGADGRGCCGDDAVESARRTAGQLRIPHYVLDMRAEFEREVVADFVSEYARGRTPNPCIRCNEALKFRRLVERAEALGAQAVATGHHARIRLHPGGGWRLLRGRDAAKDQSYFLYRLTQDRLARVLMPVGELTKAEVRERARALGLTAAAHRPESQEACFVPDNDSVAFLRRRRPELFRRGPILDETGRQVGTHDGIAGLTLGQRRGIGVALGERRYVVAIDVERNTVVVAGAASARVRGVEAGDICWVWPGAREVRTGVTARVRSQGQDVPVRVDYAAPDRLLVFFEEPQWLPAPGQAVVLWQGAVVLGGGVIERAIRE